MGCNLELRRRSDEAITLVGRSIAVRRIEPGELRLGADREFFVLFSVMNEKESPAAE